MEDTQLYVMLLGIKFPWKINRVQVDMASNRIDVWIEEAPVTKFPCAVCTQEALVVRSCRGAGVAAPGHLPVPNICACPSTADDVFRRRHEAGNLRTTTSWGYPH